jgi:predicted nucleic acid-binding protein
MAVFVFDSAPLSCFARANKLTLLEQLTSGHERVTTRAVLEEFDEGARDYPSLREVHTLAWLRVEPVDGLPELRLFAEYARSLGSGKHDIGEATVLAWAEAHHATAFTDDEVAVQLGRKRGVHVLRTLALVAGSVKQGLLSEHEAQALADELVGAGARFPFRPGAFVAWAKGQGLL